MTAAPSRPQPLIYANHAGTTWPKPDVVRSAIAEALSADPQAQAEILTSTERSARAFFGLGQGGHCVFTPGCTSALATALDGFDWQPGEGILTSAVEHHALAGPIARLVRDREIVHHVCPYRPGVPLDLDDARATLRRGNVRVVATTAASNVTGELLPFAELGALAHEHGAAFVLDAAQAAGVWPLNVDSLCVDVFAVAGHKGPLGPQGIGLVWVSPDLGLGASAATCTLGSEPEPYPGYCDVGGANVAGAAGLAAGLGWLREHEGAALGRRAVSLAAHLADRLIELDGCRVFGRATDDGEHTAVVSFVLEDLALDRTESALRDLGVVVRAGSHCAPMAMTAIGAPEGTVRVSFGALSDNGDADRIFDAIAAVSQGRIEL